MLERSGAGHAGGGLQLLDQLPGVQSIHKVNIARTTIEDHKGQLAAVVHIQFGRLLIGVTAILQFKFRHRYSPFTDAC